MSISFPEVDGLKDFPIEVAEQILSHARKYTGSARPYWIQVMGVPGSGKTTLVSDLHKNLNKRRPYTLAGFDEYMERIPEYHGEENRARAFTKFEAPARAVGFEVFRDLIDRKVDVLFEHSTTFPAVRDLMYFIKESGYVLILIRVVADIDVVKERVKARESVTSRHVPESLIEERVDIADNRWEELATIADMKTAVVNNGDHSAEETFRSAIVEVSNFIDSL